MKKILVCFDGTGNDPEDADPELDKDGQMEDENISNVLKLHLRSGGRLDSPEAVSGQLSFYYPGPGTRGGILRKAIESTLAPGSLKKIQMEALSDLQKVYQPDDEISVFGFSRGAAIARRFVSHLQTFGLAENEKDAQGANPIPVRFVGVWDTVLSEGVPQKDRDIRSPDELGETAGAWPGVGRIVHLLSIDDPRKVFTPTLCVPGDRVTEVWFAGVHSDVGGGYRKSGLSDIALEFMIERAVDEAGLTFADPADVDPGPLTGGLVEKDDLASDPDPAAIDHRKNFKKFAKEFFDALGDRKVMVLSDDIPVIHESVITRGEDEEQGYRPENLKSVRHKIWGRANVEYECISVHFTD